MTQEDKQLLLKDLSARLPYGVKVSISGDDFDEYQYPYLLTAISKFGQDSLCKVYSPVYTPLGCPSIENVKPYLRPISSMTEEELRYFAKIKFEDVAVWEIVEFPEMKCYKGFINVKCKNKNNGDTWIFQVNTRTPLETYWGIDWLNAHHFDYCGLIKSGLALEAPEGMYKI